MSRTYRVFLVVSACISLYIGLKIGSTINIEKTTTSDIEIKQTSELSKLMEQEDPWGLFASRDGNFLQTGRDFVTDPKFMLNFMGLKDSRYAIAYTAYWTDTRGIERIDELLALLPRHLQEEVFWKALDKLSLKAPAEAIDWIYENQHRSEFSSLNGWHDQLLKIADRFGNHQLLSKSREQRWNVYQIILATYSENNPIRKTRDGGLHSNQKVDIINFIATFIISNPLEALTLPDSIELDEQTASDLYQLAVAILWEREGFEVIPIFFEETPIGSQYDAAYKEIAYKMSQHNFETGFEWAAKITDDSLKQQIEQTIILAEVARTKVAILVPSK